MKYLKILILIFALGNLGFTFKNGGNSIMGSLLNSEFNATENPLNENKQYILSPVELNESNFDKEVIQSSIPVVVDFYANWCGPCKKLSPIIDELSVEYSGKIKFGKLDVDDNSNLTSKYGISSIPHMIVFKNGKPQIHIIGLLSRNEITAKLDKVLNN